MRTGANIPNDIGMTEGALEGDFSNIAGGAQAAEAGISSFSTKVGGLIEVMGDLGGSLDSLSRNPLLSFAFFDKLNHVWENKYLKTVKDAATLHRAQREEIEKTMNVLRLSSSLIATFMYNVARAQTDVRRLGFEYNQLATSGQLPGGGRMSSYDMGAMRTRESGYYSAVYNSKFATDYASMRSALQTQANFSKIQPNNAENIIKTFTAIGSKYGIDVGGGFDTMMRQYRGMGGFNQQIGMGLAAQMSRASKEGEYGPGSPNEQFMTMLQLTDNLRNKGYGVEKAFQTADVTMRAMQEKNGLNLSANKIRSLMPAMRGGLDYSRDITSGMLTGVSEEEYQSKMNSPGGLVWKLSKLNEYFTKQRDLNPDNFNSGTWAGMGENKAYIDALGLSVENVRDIVDLNGTVLKSLADNVGKTSISFKDAEKVFQNIASGKDPYYRNLVKEQSQFRNLSDVVSGGFKLVQTGATGLAELSGQSPAYLQMASIVGGTLVAKLLTGSIISSKMRQMGDVFGAGMISSLQNSVKTNSNLQNTPGAAFVLGLNPTITPPKFSFTRSLAPMGAMMGYSIIENLLNQQANGQPTNYMGAAGDALSDPVNYLYALPAIYGAMKNRGGTGGMFKSGNAQKLLGIGGMAFGAMDMYQGFSGMYGAENNLDRTNAQANIVQGGMQTAAGASFMYGNVPAAAIFQLGASIIGTAQSIAESNAADALKTQNEANLKSLISGYNTDLELFKEGGKGYKLLENGDTDAASYYQWLVGSKNMAENELYKRKRAEGGGDTGSLDVNINVGANGQLIPVGSENVSPGEHKSISINNLSGYLTQPHY